MAAAHDVSVLEIFSEMTCRSWAPEKRSYLEPCRVRAALRRGDLDRDGAAVPERPGWGFSFD